MQCHDPSFNLTYADNMQVGVLGVVTAGGGAEADLAGAGALVGLQTAEALLAWVPLAQVSKPAAEQCHMCQGVVEQEQLFWRCQDKLWYSPHRLQQQQAQLLQQLQLSAPQQWHPHLQHHPHRHHQAGLHLVVPLVVGMQGDHWLLGFMPAARSHLGSRPAAHSHLQVSPAARSHLGSRLAAHSHWEVKPAAHNNLGFMPAAHSHLGSRPVAHSHLEVKPVAHSGLEVKPVARIRLGLHGSRLLMELVL